MKIFYLFSKSFLIRLFIYPCLFGTLSSLSSISLSFTLLNLKVMTLQCILSDLFCCNECLFISCLFLYSYCHMLTDIQVFVKISYLFIDIWDIRIASSDCISLSFQYFYSFFILAEMFIRVSISIVMVISSSFEWENEKSIIPSMICISSSLLLYNRL